MKIQNNNKYQKIMNKHLSIKTNQPVKFLDTIFDINKLLKVRTRHFVHNMKFTPLFSFIAKNNQIITVYGIGYPDLTYDKALISSFFSIAICEST